MSGEDITRRFVPPLGWPLKYRGVTLEVRPDHPRFVWNRYPRQVIGFVVRLPDADNDHHPAGRHRALSVMWSKPARWWSR